ncbi:MAG: hypothetical protein ACK5PQ_02435 [Alphaproteobacteria bacterium]
MKNQHPPTSSGSTIPQASRLSSPEGLESVIPSSFSQNIDRRIAALQEQIKALEEHQKAFIESLS